MKNFLLFLCVLCYIDNLYANEKSEIFYKNQVWIGQYECAQGVTDLRLIIKKVSGNKLNAIFDFNYNNGQAVGKFSMYGTYDDTSRELLFIPEKWIYNPNNFGMISLNGLLNTGKVVYQGSIPGCKWFKVISEDHIKQQEKKKILASFADKSELQETKVVKEKIKIDSGKEFFEAINKEDTKPVDLENNSPATTQESNNTTTNTKDYFEKQKKFGSTFVQMFKHQMSVK